jgi:hypothetical protein
LSDTHVVIWGLPRLATLNAQRAAFSISKTLRALPPTPPTMTSMHYTGSKTVAMEPNIRASQDVRYRTPYRDDPVRKMAQQLSNYYAHH